MGIVDFDHRDFHGYSRCPDGTTCNAYLIRDKKNVLVDTVQPGWANAMLLPHRERDRSGKIDYIICNHMELDHQGAC